jgi:diguanylate cyclase (GGDEF)-like protein
MAVLRSLERQLLLGYILPIVCIAVVTALSLSAFRVTQQATGMVAHTRDVLGQLRQLGQQEDQAVIAYQQALLTWNVDDQRAYERARQNFGRLWLTVYGNVQDNPAQQALLRSWQANFNAWDEAVVRPTLRTQTGGPPVADLSLLRGDDDLAARLLRAEEALLDGRQAAARRSTRAAYWGTLLGLPLAAGLTWLLGQHLLRRIRRGTRQLMWAAERVTAGDLSARVSVTGNDELTQLSERFNAMAGHLQQVVGEQRELQQTLEQRVGALVQDTTREIQLLGQLGTFMQACQNEREAYDVICRTGEVLFPESGDVALLAASRNLLDVEIRWGALLPGREMFGPEDCWALRLGQPHAVGADQSRPRCPHDHSDTPSLCLPLTAQGDTLGVLTLNFASEEVMQQTQPLAQRFAERVALSLANLRLRATLRQQSIRDSLTGLYNRRYLEETGARELARARRRSLPLSVLMIDVDHFKTVNDTHGHALGDAVLRRLAAHFQRFFRAEDVVCRYGGEEFAVILPDCDAGRAGDRAEALRRSVEDLAVTSGDAEMVAVTISVGGASWPDHAQTPEALLARADAALYRAKHAGRNRVEFGLPAPPEAPESEAPEVGAD